MPRSSRVARALTVSESNGQVEHRCIGDENGMEREDCCEHFFYSFTDQSILLSV